MKKKELRFFSFDFWNLIFYILVIITSGGCATLTRYKETKPIPEAKMEVKEAMPELRIKERLTYGIYWMNIPVGTAVAEVKEIVEINGKKAYHLIGSAFSNRWLSFIFKVNDRVESFVDKETFKSIKHIAIRNEGKYHAHMVLEYDWDNKILRFQNLADGTDKTFPLPEEAVDEFTAFYYFRLQNISLDKPLEFTVNQVEKNWLVRLYMTSFGKINIPEVGIFESFMLEPVLNLGGEKLDKGNAWVWVSNDERRIPLMIKLQVNITFIGTVLAVLRKIE